MACFSLVVNADNDRFTGSSSVLMSDSGIPILPDSIILLNISSVTLCVLLVFSNWVFSFSSLAAWIAFAIFIALFS